MEPKESNWTLLPFTIGALAFALLMCLTGGGGPLALAVRFVLCFALGYLALALLFVLMLAAVSLYINQNEPQTRYQPFYNHCVTFVMGLVPAFFRVRIHARGTDKLPVGRWLLAGNHRSGFDPLVTGWVLRRHRLAFITKPSIQRLPIVGNFIHKACFLGIDRDNDRAALRTVLQAIRLLKEDVISIGVYPEGTRNTGEGLLPFRNGAFKIAQKAKVPVVIVAVSGTERIMKNFPWRHTDVTVDICGMLEAGKVGELTTGEIGDRVRETILSALP